MKRSSKTGVILALFLTMSSSFMLRDHGGSAGLPFALPTAQASVGDMESKRSTSSGNDAGLTVVMPVSSRRQALIDRVRRQLAQASDTHESISH